MAATKGVTILGSTGSIGVSTLDVIGRHPDRFHVVALTAHQNLDLVLQQALQFKPRYVVLREPAKAEVLRNQLLSCQSNTEVLSGEEGLCHVSSLPDVSFVMAAIVGAAGLLPTLAAVKAGKRVLLANKEALVMGGHFFMNEVARSGAELLPIDSEHNAIFQCMPSGFYNGLRQAGVARILLTGSGGPFRTTPLETLSAMTPDQACAHPNWSMGRKISVDSATMMNKGLEFIEACLMFNAAPDQVEVVIHPQSVIHSMVEYHDGSVLAQMGHPDMRTPIAYGLGWPERISSGVPLLDLVKVAQLQFEAPDEYRFPCLKLARQAILTGDWAPITLNAANEVAVASFLQEQIRFTDIAGVIEHSLGQMETVAIHDLDSILATDRIARELATREVERIQR